MKPGARRGGRQHMRIHTIPLQSSSLRNAKHGVLIIDEEDEEAREKKVVRCLITVLLVSRRLSWGKRRRCGSSHTSGYSSSDNGLRPKRREFGARCSGGRRPCEIRAVCVMVTQPQIH